MLQIIKLQLTLNQLICVNLRKIIIYYFIQILEAMVIGSDLDILKIMLTVICREELHVQEDMVQDYIRRFANRLDLVSLS